MNNKEINLERILDTIDPYYHQWKDCFSDTKINFILDAMKAACEQTILLCAENAELNIPTNDWQDRYIDHDSILDIKKQIR